ncbi:hypothetical protein, partial [Microscilla marina]
HAYYQGFRVPVEGVEYINIVVGLISFIDIIFSIFGSIAIYWLLTKNYNMVKGVLEEDSHRSQKQKNLRATIILISATMFSCLVFGFSESSIIITNTIFCIIAITVIYFLRTEVKRKIGAMIAVLLGIIIIICSLFYQPLYTNFLRTIKYGGEILIEIQYRKADNTEANLRGKLLIRTQKSITIKNEKTLSQEEVPMNRVSKITFLKDTITKSDGELVKVQYLKADKTDANLIGYLLARTQKSIIIKNRKTSHKEEILISRVSKIVFLKDKTIKKVKRSKKSK